MAERNFACVHAHWLLPQAIVHSLIPSESRAPYIAIAHGADVHAMNGAVGSAMLRTAIRRASGVVGVSHSLLATLRRRFPSEMDARPSTVIGTGVATERFSPALRADDWVATQHASRPVILYVGRLAEKKGVEFLLAAMASPPLASLPASLVIIGDGTFARTVEGALQRNSNWQTESAFFRQSATKTLAVTWHRPISYVCLRLSPRAAIKREDRRYWWRPPPAAFPQLHPMSAAFENGSMMAQMAFWCRRLIR